MKYQVDSVEELRKTMNRFACGCVILGRVRRGKFAPTTSYADDMGLTCTVDWLFESMAGTVLDEKRHIRMRPMDDYIREFYVDSMNELLCDVPREEGVDPNKPCEDGFLPFREEIHSLVENLYQIFRKIVRTRLRGKLGKLPDDRYLPPFGNYHKAAKLVTAIMIHKGKDVSELAPYLEDLPDKLPHYAEKLITRDIFGNCSLKHGTDYNRDYYLALFCALFSNSPHTSTLFERKAIYWEKHRPRV